MVCICIFQVYHLEEHLKDYPVASDETMYRFGIGFKSIIQKRYHQKEKGFQNLSLMRHCLKLDSNSSGYGLQLSQKTGKFSHYPYPRRETCLLQRDSSQALVKIHGKHPVSTDGGTWYPQACRFLRLKHHHPFLI